MYLTTKSYKVIYTKKKKIKEVAHFFLWWIIRSAYEGSSNIFSS